ncbi:hypothetical protein MtrunA17_Chr8g0388191 [Medicago truncatula]|uniref:DUF7890 domain-containing protein n=1 Tax=Medicago truncatula TaxID=3880 RepID=A0A072TWH3_MEDTR|nr:hypothetical protein MTR_8g099485 [Medicago truncatula]RHN43469.1 hypothetical protein MtrunA17_Chr8g0388191 [Medicago truncatula]
MISTMFACLKKTSHKKVKVEQIMKATKDVCELTKKQPTCKTMKKRVRFVDSEPTILGEENEKDQFEKRRCISNELGEKEGIRVKIRLTKEQATQLLSKCNGSALEFNDLAHELLSIPGNRVSIVETINF